MLLLRLVLYGLSISLCQCWNSNEFEAIDKVHTRLQSAALGTMQRALLNLYSTVSVAGDSNVGKLDRRVSLIHADVCKMMLFADTTDQELAQHYSQLSELLNNYNQYIKMVQSVKSSGSFWQNKLVLAPVSVCVEKFVAFQAHRIAGMYRDLLQTKQQDWTRASAIVSIASNAMRAGIRTVSLFSTQNYSSIKKDVQYIQQIMTPNNSTIQKQAETAFQDLLLQQATVTASEEPSPDTYLAFLTRMFLYMGQSTVMAIFCFQLGYNVCSAGFAALLSMAVMVWVAVLLRYLDSGNLLSHL